MNQADLIIKLKEILKDKFNPDASFLIMQPFFKENTVGLKKDELKRGVYVLLLDRDNNPSDKVLYFKTDNPATLLPSVPFEKLKYHFPLQNIGDYATTSPLVTPEERLSKAVDKLNEEFGEGFAVGSLNKE